MGFSKPTEKKIDRAKASLKALRNTLSKRGVKPTITALKANFPDKMDYIEEWLSLSEIRSIITFDIHWF